MSQVIEVKIPDIGDFKNVPVIEVLVKPGDAVGKEDPLVSLESDKATMEVPSPAAGVVKELKVKVGDKVSEGTAVLTLDATDGAGAAPPPAESKPEPRPSAPPPRTEAKAPVAPPPAKPDLQQTPAEREAPRNPATPLLAAGGVDEEGFARAHASPAVRRFARELGVDLARVKGTGPSDRVLKEDVQNHVKAELARPRG